MKSTTVSTLFIISCSIIILGFITNVKADDPSKEGFCLMTSNGFNNGSFGFPTVPNTKPFYLDAESNSLLGTICPHLVDQSVCCNSTQVTTMAARFTMLDAT